MPKTPILHVLTIVDGASEEVLEVIEIPQFSLEKFMFQFDVDEVSDPDMHGRYSVGPDDAAFLRGALGTSMEFDFSKKAYFIDAVRDDR